MYMVIAVGFVFVITALLSFGSYYECEHFDENHGLKRRRLRKRVHARH